ncbi:MAG: agmatine deiminase family protein [Rubripirellula sp.]
MSLFNNTRRSLPRKPQSRKPRRSRLETLETRQLMAANLMSDGTWNISGTNRSDEIYVARDTSNPSVLIAEINGRIVDEQFESDVSKIQIKGRRGNDLIEIDQSAGRIAIPTVLQGNSGNDVIVGGDGDDFIDGGRGHDELVGGPGNDRIFGRGGDDYLEGGDGDDILDGGRGYNEVVDSPNKPTDPVDPIDPIDPVDPQATKPTNRVPAEWEQHDSTWMQWPKGEEASYRNNFAGIIDTLQAYEQVNLAVESSQARTEAQNFLRQKGVPLDNVQFHIMPYDWSWMRDNGAIWVEQTGANGGQQMIVQDWGFDGWGGDGGPSRKDDAVPCKVAGIEGVPCETVPVVLEKGTLEFNGSDTVISSWTVLHDRNPDMTRSQLDVVLKERFGVSKVVWIEGASQGDLTDGHVDGIARFINENTVVVSRYTDQSDADSALFENAAATIRAAGLNVVRMDIPGYVRYRGEWLPANYTNYLVANGVVIASSYGNEAFDNNARRQLQGLFPNHDIVLTDTRELWYNGGAVHCVTNDQPLLIQREASDRATKYQSTPLVADLVMATESDDTKPDDAESEQDVVDEFDLNGDGKVTAVDALIMINRLADRHSSPQLIDAAMADADDLDINGDGRLSSVDALMMINQIARSRTLS